MRAAAGISCGLLAGCLAVCVCYADGKCTQESLNPRKLPSEIAGLFPHLDGASLEAAFCKKPGTGRWTIMFVDGWLQCTSNSTCTAPSIGGISMTVESAESRVNTVDVVLSSPQTIAPLLSDSHVRYMAPNCSVPRYRPPFKADKSEAPAEMPSPAVFTGATEDACERYDSAQWGMADACVPVWAPGATTPMVIAVLDSGIDCLHPSIKGRIGDGTAPNGHRRCHASAGTNYLFPGLPPDNCSNSEPLACASHGTAVAGIIASNAPQVPGVDPHARLLSMRILDGNSSLDFVQPWTQVAKAILDSGEDAQIINISANWYSNEPWLAAAIDKLTKHPRRLVVSAARGVDDRIAYPAAFTKCNDAVIGVSEISKHPHEWPPYSWSTGDTDEAYMVAPGVNVLTSYSDEHTLYPGDKKSASLYRLQVGSSFAAPHVTGAASLVWSAQEFANCSAAGVRELLECSARITLIGAAQDARKRLHLGCLFRERGSPICRGAERCITSVKKEHCQAP
jgi:subtilisin family serine protease